MAGCILVLPNMPENCAICPFKNNDYCSPADCKAIIVNTQDGRWVPEANIDKYVRTNTKSPHCPLQPI